MDVRMPGVDGLRATELVLRLPDPPRVLVVTTFEPDDYVLDALPRGVGLPAQTGRCRRVGARGPDRRRRAEPAVPGGAARPRPPPAVPPATAERR